MDIEQLPAGCEIEAITTFSLGDTSYLIVSGDEVALVDPQRDSWDLLEKCRQRQLSLRYILETHVHNDYVSGALEARAATGAMICGPAGARYEFPYMPLGENDEIVVGELVLRAMETPGHTPEHTAYVISHPTRTAPLAVLTGGSLINGSSGRTDLLGSQLNDSLARAQYLSLRRLARLPGHTRVLPTHGAGSFCASGPATSQVTSTIEEQLHLNPDLLVADEEQFLRSRPTTVDRYPAYYRYVAPINQAGPHVLGAYPVLAARSSGAAAKHTDQGGYIVDARDRNSFAAAHIRGSLNIELDDSFATYVGWLVPFNAPLLLVLPAPVEVSGPAAVGQLLRIGYDRALGYLDGGIEHWRATGRPVRSYPVADVTALPPDLDAREILDVRQPAEHATGHIPGSRHIFIGDLAEEMAQLPRARNIWTICTTGRRAALAASLLDGAGIPVTAVVSGGVPDCLATRAKAGNRP
jgi:glyoxylase-like metal-dependent hydrolase (beta-lactamase superfamily II)/rhodanese-related sulfurtransferase